MRKKPWRFEEERWFEKLVLPSKLKAALTLQADQASELRAAAEEREEAAEAARDAANVAAQTKLSIGAGSAKDEPFVIGAPKLKGRGPRIPLFDSGLLIKMAEKSVAVGLSDKQRKDTLVKTLRHVAARGPRRIVHRRADWEPELRQLRLAHANFTPVLDLIEEELALAGAKRPIVLPPMLLNGPPGCGKTFFAENLAKFFETGFERMSMETMQSSGEFTGTSAFWSNAAPGRLFNRLVDYDHANPVFLLDEVDKAAGSTSYRPEKALYTLLERESAKHWSDSSLPDLPLDTSHVVWLLTSNDASRVAEPLLSRMERFDIQPMNAHEARRLARALYAKEVDRYPHLGLARELSIAHCDVLRCYSPRVVARLVHKLVARLAKEKRIEVGLSDLEAVGALGDVLVDFDRYVGGSVKWTMQ